MSLLAEKPVGNKILARQRLMMQMAAAKIVHQKLLTGEFELRDGKITKGKNFPEFHNPQLHREC
jgi:hypothetical protein